MKSSLSNDDANLEVDTTCVREDGQHCLVGVRCHQCDHYKGMRNNFVLCGYHTEDDEGAQPTRCLLANEVREQAMKALDYL